MSQETTEVRSLFIPLTNANLLLPGTMIAEIVPYVRPASTGITAPSWLLGTVKWRNAEVPVVCFEPLLNAGQPTAGARARIAVVKAATFTHGGSLSHYGILAQQNPRLRAVYEDGIETDSSIGTVGNLAVAARVLVNSEPAIIPDLNYLEAQLKRVMQS